MSKAGLHVSGNVPFGYKRNNDTKNLKLMKKQHRQFGTFSNFIQKDMGALKLETF